MILESKRNVMGGKKGSLSITLPIGWVKSRNIQIGDPLDVLGGKFLLVAPQGTLTEELKGQINKILG